MPTKAERTALVFLSAVILGGGVVRLVRAARGGLRPAPAAATALARQKRATDSMARSPSPRSEGPPVRGRRGAARGRATQNEPSAQAPTFPIDVDRASAKELEALPRVGPTLATRIVAERDTHGHFGSLDALDQRVKGIGPAMVNALRPFVTFSGR